MSHDSTSAADASSISQKLFLGVKAPVEVPPLPPHERGRFVHRVAIAEKVA